MIQFWQSSPKLEIIKPKNKIDWILYRDLANDNGDSSEYKCFKRIQENIKNLSQFNYTLTGPLLILPFIELPPGQCFGYVSNCYLKRHTNKNLEVVKIHH